MSADDLVQHTPETINILFKGFAHPALAAQVGGDHYRQGGIQPVQYIEANALGFLEGCVVKRLTRHNRPTGKGLQDIDKAIHELQLLRELRYGGETK